jgi:hypothetical protein
LCFPSVQQRDQSLDFLELMRHSVTMFLVVILLGEIMFSDLDHQNACQKENERISTMPFLLWHFSPGDKIENCSAQ